MADIKTSPVLQQQLQLASLLARQGFLFVAKRGHDLVNKTICRKFAIINIDL